MESLTIPKILFQGLVVISLFIATKELFKYLATDYFLPVTIYGTICTILIFAVALPFIIGSMNIVIGNKFWEHSLELRESITLMWVHGIILVSTLYISNMVLTNVMGLDIIQNTLYLLGIMFIPCGLIGWGLGELSE